jgi:hypothetical protein
MHEFGVVTLILALPPNRDAAALWILKQAQFDPVPFHLLQLRRHKGLLQSNAPLSCASAGKTSPLFQDILSTIKLSMPIVALISGGDLAAVA